MAKVLITGATGFVGRRLVFALLEKGHEVCALCRIKGTTLLSEDRPGLTYVWGDLRNPDCKNLFPKDIDAAYYLMHSMSEFVKDLTEAEIDVADRFVKNLKATQARQIIYLGGIVNDERHLSPHLKSRLLVEGVLKNSGIPTTILRASIIVGSGSASFEIIRDLCEKLPFMIAPKWLKSPCQPIAIQDVLCYLSRVLLCEKVYDQTFDIGGPEVLTFKQLLLEYAKYRNLRRYILDVPVLTPRLSSFWLVFVTSVRFSLCFYLVESITQSSVVRLGEIQRFIPHTCLTFRKALELAFQNIAQNEVISTWMDAWDSEDLDPSISKYIAVPHEGCLTDEREMPIQDSSKEVLNRIWKIGGANGYYGMDWAWTLRGWMDRMIGGVGLNRGRRHPTEIIVGDSIDFWRVLKADKEAGHLILYAGMKMPGEAWLEFSLQERNGEKYLMQKATFRPKGVLGRLYWYVLLPFHHFIFLRMAKALAGFRLHSGGIV